MPRVLFTDFVEKKAAAVMYFTGTRKEDIHLLYSLEREHGPGIIRDGVGPPRMALINRPWETTTNPLIQRMGTWFIKKELKEKFINEKEFEKKLTGLVPNKEINKLVQELKDTQDYWSYFKEHYGEKKKIVGLQSFGDLTMNLWNVAFVNLPENSKEAAKVPKLIFLGDEPINDRIYTCLVKWRKGSQGKRPVSIESLRFSRYVYDENPKNPKVVMMAESEDAIADQIEFAASGQLLIRNGELIKPQEIVHQFSDIRHLLALPNLNPNGPLYKKDKNILDKMKRPRFYFGYERYDDVWFGESQLIADRNLRRAALTGAIELSRLYPGANEEQIKAALRFQTIKEGHKFRAQSFYEEGQNPPHPLGPSQWRFVMEDRSLVVVRLRPNIYPCSILGVTNAGDVVCFTWRGNYTTPPGYTILHDDVTIKGERVISAARELLNRSSGLTDAILLDEGNDVRHEVFDPDPDVNGWRELVIDEKNRDQVRAIFLFSCYQKT